MLYHYEGQLDGDYELLDTEEEIEALLLKRL